MEKSYGGGSMWEPPLGFKVCRECLISKSLEEDFYAATKDASGRVKTWQSYCKDCMREKVRKRARKRRRRQGVPVRGAYGPRGQKLPAKPFIKWLQKQENIAALARLAGVDESRLRRLKNDRLHGQKRLTVDFIDRVLLADGGRTQIWELYDKD